MMEILKNRKNLLRYVTCLKLGMLSSPSHYSNFQALADSCPNLSNLSFEFCCPNGPNDLPWTEINYLSAVKTFENLKSLELRIADIFTFLKDFALPPLVENLSLSFEQCLSIEILCRINHIFTDHLEQNPTLSTFYENFQPLHSLKVLQIVFPSDINPEGYKYQNYLAQSILKRISLPLKQLTFMGAPPSFYRKKDAPIFINDQLLPQLFQSLSHLSQTLEVLKIGSERAILSKFDLSSFKSKFVKLSTVTITGILENSDINILLFLEQITSLGDSLVTIKLRTFIDCNSKSLMSLVKQLIQLEKPKKLKLELQIKLFQSSNDEALRSDFKDFMKESQESVESRPKLRGVTLKLYVDENILMYLRAFLGIYSKKFDNFVIVSGVLPFT